MANKERWKTVNIYVSMGKKMKKKKTKKDMILACFFLSFFIIKKHVFYEKKQLVFCPATTLSMSLLSLPHKNNVHGLYSIVLFTIHQACFLLPT